MNDHPCLPTTTEQILVALVVFLATVKQVAMSGSPEERTTVARLGQDGSQTVAVWTKIDSSGRRRQWRLGKISNQFLAVDRLDR